MAIGLTRREIALSGLGASIGVVGGFAAGYFSLKKQMELKYEAIAEREIAEMREHFERQSALQRSARIYDKPPLDKLVDDLEYRSRDRTKPEEVEAIEPPPMVVQANVFKDVLGEPTVWNYEDELKGRSDDRPYIIHKDEYMTGENEYDQSTLTYFEGDDVLCDERDQIVDDHDAMVGMENLVRFGHGSSDVNVLYVRNDRLNLDIEVIRSSGRYAEEVYGLPDDRELEHSKRRRTRFDDD